VRRDADRPVPAPDIDRATALVRDGSLARVLRTMAGLPRSGSPA
jgi:hypothetical protein